MNIGRKIYYELATGNVIVDTGERQGDVIDTTIDQDFAIYGALQPYQRNSVGILRVAFGGYASNFAKYPYHIDPTTKIIVWDTDNPIGATLADMQAAKIAQLDDFCNQTILSGFTSYALGEEHRYGFDTEDQANLTGRLTILNANPNYSEPFIWKTLDAGPLPHTKAQFISMCTDGDAWKNQNISKFWQLKGQVMAATSADEVNAITW